MRYLLIMFFGWSSFLLNAQNPVDVKGFNFGTGFFNEQMPEGVYQPLLCLGHLAWNLRREENHQKPNAFYWYFEPQINPVFISGNLNDLEFGLNGGLYFLYNLSKNINNYIGIGSGPHFISVKTNMQAPGFIFSDNFFAGFEIALNTNYVFNIQYRFRHISNAGLQSPNLGLDNHFLVLGLIRYRK